MHYVSGLVFDYDHNYVLLLEKRRPERFNGLLFPVGGKIELGEWPKDAMIREFDEEAGVEEAGWDLFLRLTYPKENIKVYFYRLFSNDVLRKAYSRTDEPINVYRVCENPIFPVVGNTLGHYKEYSHKPDLPTVIEIAKMMDSNPVELQRYP